MEISLAFRAYGARFLSQLPRLPAFEASMWPEAFWATMPRRHIWLMHGSVSRRSPQLHAFRFGQISHALNLNHARNIGNQELRRTGQLARNGRNRLLTITNVMSARAGISGGAERQQGGSFPAPSRFARDPSSWGGKSGGGRVQAILHPAQRSAPARFPSCLSSAGRDPPSRFYPEQAAGAGAGRRIGAGDDGGQVQRWSLAGMAAFRAVARAVWCPRCGG